MEKYEDERNSSNDRPERAEANLVHNDQYDSVQAALRYAEPIYPLDLRSHSQAESSQTNEGTPDGAVPARSLTSHFELSDVRIPPSHSRFSGDRSGQNDLTGACPIVPLGHRSGSYSFISASGELRTMRAEALEAGRGVRALFSGVSQEAENWCRENFGTPDGDWLAKDAGRWIIKSCNAAGIFDPNLADIRSIGVWRDGRGFAVAHCGDQLINSDGQVSPLAGQQGKHIMKGAAPITRPARLVASDVAMSDLLERLRVGWGWKHNCDPDVFFGWLMAAYLGGFPKWRSHLYVHGTRGSGKSRLMELAAKLLGDMAGNVVNDATEAGLRQSRNDQARPILIDEFEPDENVRNGSRQDGILALFRRMSGEQGGRISRGGADHSSVSFRALGAGYVTSINHIHLEPQDRSRFVLLELGSLPSSMRPAESAAALAELEECAEKLAARVFRRMLSQSCRWDTTHAMIVAEARRLGADPRQGDTAATILAGRDLGLFDVVPDDQRLRELGPILEYLLDNASEADEAREGADVLDALLSSEVILDHGVRRTIGDLLESVIAEETIVEINDPERKLAQHGVYVLRNKSSVAVRLSKTSPTAKHFKETKWRNGAHASAMLKVAGAEKPPNPVRLPRGGKQRVILLPFSSLPFVDD